jgi:hypothetical protein
MATVPLTNGGLASVSDADADLVGRYRWYSVRRKSTNYAETSVGRERILMHRLLMGAGHGEVVDHVNGNGLDNRRENMRLCHQRDNARNRRGSKSSRSGVKGVSWRTDISRWRARIMVSRREIALGVFDSREEAIAAYNTAARAHFGQFAKDAA